MQRRHPHAKRRIIENRADSGDGKLGLETDPRAASVVLEEVGNHERLQKVIDPEGDHMESGSAVVKSSLHGRPRQDVVPLEAAERLEGGHCERRLDDSVELETKLAGRRCPADDLWQGLLGRFDEVFLVFVDVGGEQKELSVCDREAS